MPEGSGRALTVKRRWKNGPGSAIFWGKIHPQRVRGRTSVSLGGIEEGNQMLFDSQRNMNLWTLEIAPGLRVRLEFRKMLQNKLPPSEMGAIREHSMVSKGAASTRVAM